MAYPNSLFHRTLAILNSSLLFVFLAGLLEFPIVGSYVPAYLRPLWAGLGIPAICILKICFYAGIYGTLLEFAVGQTAVLQWDRFKENIRRFWKICFLIAALPFVLHFLCFVGCPGKNVPFALVSVYGDVLFSGLLVHFLILKRYLRPHGLRTRAVILKDQDALCLLLLASLNICVYNLPHFFDLSVLRFERISVFFFRYTHLFLFLYLAQTVLEAYPGIKERFVFNKELYLINPAGGAVFGSLVSLFLRGYPPWFVVLKALTPASYHVREFNRVFWRPRFFAGGKLVAVSCYSSNSADAYKIAKEFKKRGSTVVMGGPHVTALPDEALEFCDGVIIGEAEGVWPRVIADYENHNLQKKYLSREDNAAFQKVHQYLLNSPPEIIRDFMETTRGCKYDCFFCAIPNLGRDCLRKKPVSEVVELIKKVKIKYRNFMFIDNNIYSDPAYAQELFQALKPLRVTWNASSSIDIGQNDAVLSMAKEGGCQNLLLGYEIGADSDERGQGGKLSMARKYLELTRKIQQKKIGIKAHFMAGFDSDNLRSLWSLWNFCARLRPAFTILLILTPLPGSRFFQQALAEDRILTLNWRNYNCQTIVFQPKRLPLFVLAQPVYSFIFFIFFTTTSVWGWLILAYFIISVTAGR